MSFKSVVSLLLLNVIIICFGFLIYFKFYNNDFHTRINLYGAKLHKDGVDGFVNSSTDEEIFEKFKIGFSGQCTFNMEKSVEGDSIFFDIGCQAERQASLLFRELFWSYFGSEMKGLGYSWTRRDQMENFYYINSLGKVPLSGNSTIVLPRYSFVIIDQPTKLRTEEFISYLLVSLVAMNAFIFVYINKKLV